VPLALGIVVFERFMPSFWLRVGQAVYAEHMMKAVSHMTGTFSLWASMTYRWPNVQAFHTVWYHC